MKSFQSGEFKLIQCSVEIGILTEKWKIRLIWSLVGIRILTECGWHRWWWWWCISFILACRL